MMQPKRHWREEHGCESTAIWQAQVAKEARPGRPGKAKRKSSGAVAASGSYTKARCVQLWKLSGALLRLYSYTVNKGVPDLHFPRTRLRTLFQFPTASLYELRYPFPRLSRRNFAK